MASETNLSLFWSSYSSIEHFLISSQLHIFTLQFKYPIKYILNLKGIFKLKHNIHKYFIKSFNLISIFITKYNDFLWTIQFFNQIRVLLEFHFYSLVYFILLWNRFYEQDLFNFSFKWEKQLVRKSTSAYFSLLLFNCQQFSLLLVVTVGLFLLGLLLLLWNTMIQSHLWRAVSIWFTYPESQFFDRS